MRRLLREQATHQKRRRFFASAMLGVVAATLFATACSSSTAGRMRARQYNRMAARAYQLEDVETALKLCAQAVAADPTYAEAWLNQGVIALESNRRDAAIDLFREALYHDPANVRARIRLAAELLREDEPGEAEMECRRALAQDPDNANAYFLLGMARERMGDKATAASCYLKGLALDPEAADFWERFCELTPTS